MSQDSFASDMNQVENSVKDIELGNIYWILHRSDFVHPFVVIEIPQPNITDFLLCGITTNQKKASMPGNVVLNEGEGNLSKPSIVDVANVVSVNKDELGEFVGKLDEKRIEEIKAGIQFLKSTYFDSRRNSV